MTILVLLFLSTVINYIDRQALSVLLPTLRTELSLTSAHYGAITTAFLLAFTFASVPFGMWVDRIGTRLGLASAIVGWSIAAILHAFVHGPLGLGIFRSVLGLAEAGNFPAGTKAIAVWFPPKRRAFAMAVFDCGTAAGAILAPPLVTFLALHVGWRWAFILTGLLGFVWLVVWLIVYHAPDRHPWLTPEQRAALLREVGNVAPKPSVFGSALRRIIGRKELWGLMLTRLTVAPVWWFYVFWLPDYLVRARGFSLLEMGLYAWIPFLTVDIGRLLGGMVSDHLLSRGYSATVARKSVMVVGALAMVSGIQVVGADSASGALAWVCGATFGFGVWSANILAVHADLFPAETMGSATGVTLMASSLSGAGFTYLVGQFLDTMGYTPIFWAIGLLPLLACVPLFVIIRRIERIREA